MPRRRTLVRRRRTPQRQIVCNCVLRDPIRRTLGVFEIDTAVEALRLLCSNVPQVEIFPLHSQVPHSRTIPIPYDYNPV